ncbi:hypothetical protein V7122_15460 [Bacillus sp. JJ1532]
MNEYVSNCADCGKMLYCLDGFFNGVHTENNESLCFDCADKKKKSEE